MRGIAVALVFAACAAVAAAYTLESAFAREAKYVQAGCEISEAYFAYIYLTAEADAGKPNARKYSVEFNPEHVIVRFPPAYYALNWQDTTVVLEYSGDVATLSLRNPRFPVASRTRPIGEIQRDCWVKVKGYIERNVHVPLHIVETTAGI